MHNATLEYELGVIPFESTFKDNIDDISLEEQKRDKIFLKTLLFVKKKQLENWGKRLLGI